MTGIYQHSIDSKGRLSIPVRLRDDLGKEFHVTISDENCLKGYPAESWERIREKQKAMSKLKQKKLRPIFSNAEKVEPDTQGRILLPQRLRDRVGLKKNVAVVGNGECVEFWDSEAWAEVYAIESTPERIAEVYEELDF